VTDLETLLAVMGPKYPTALKPSFGQTSKSTEPMALFRPRGLFDDSAEPTVRKAMDELCDLLSQEGASIKDMLPPAAFCEIIPRHRTVMAVEAAQFHGGRLGKHPEDYQPRIRELIEDGLRCSATEYADCKQHQQQLSVEMMMVGAPLVTPATTSVAPDKGTTGDPAFNSPWSYTGMATVSIPTGQFVEGLPLAVQIVVGRRHEAEIFRAAAWVEKALGVGPLTPPLPR
jgi:Asp-tRNA(Asn)/Glu-tRNA(Gln) amidotransferase A subunit family amidase